MEHIKEQLAKQHKVLQEKRWKKVRKLCESNGMSWTLERLEQLRTRNHIDSVLCNVEDLMLGEVSMEESNMEEEVQVAVQAVEEDDNGRLIGRFVSGSVVNLSRRELSKEDVSLLSKGLKFSPTPTDIDKAQLKADIEDFKRRMRLRWHFRNSEDDSFTYDDNHFRIKSTWQPPKDDSILENYFSLLEREELSVSPEGKNFSDLSPPE